MKSKASELVFQAKQWASHYGDYPNGAEGAVVGVTLRIRGAWESNDADAFGDVFTNDASMLVGDEQLTSREAIRAYMARAFAGGWRGSRIEDDPIDIFFISQDVALVTSLGGVVQEGESSLPPEREVRTTWVVVKTYGEWKLFSYQSSPVAA
jgi:uncharacterized protein (TIGR02246 family)